MASYDVWNSIFKYSLIIDLARWMRINCGWKKNIIKSLLHRRTFNIKKQNKDNNKENITYFALNYCNKLYHLDLDLYDNYNHYTLRLFKIFINKKWILKYVFISNTWNNITNFISCPVEKFLKSLPTSLQILSIRARIEYENINQIGILFPFLTGLHIKVYNRHVDVNAYSKSIEYLTMKCTNLIVFSIDVFDLINAHVFMPYLKKCKYLALDGFVLTPSNCELLYPNLIELNLEKCHYNPMSFKMFIKQCPNIIHLIITCTDGKYYGDKLDVSFEKLLGVLCDIKICPHLVQLTVVPYYLYSYNVGEYLYYDKLKKIRPTIIINDFRMGTGISTNFKSTCIRAGIMK